jgi:hemerythrin-like domain-containing protein
MQPTEELKAEHEGILQMLEVLERICERMESREPFLTDHLDQIVEFLKIFVDTCHHGKEEDILFPALKKAGITEKEELINELLAEHRTGRTLVKDMGVALDSLKRGTEDATFAIVDKAREYITLLKQHIQKENTDLFPIAEKRLPQDEQNELSEQFDRLEKEKIGVGRHEEFHRQMKELSETYLR